MSELRLSKNIKVHFAGMEKITHAIIAQNSGIKYGLWSCYPFLAKKLNLNYLSDFVKTDDKSSTSEINRFEKHTIMDSGIFTLMFGSQAGKKDKGFIDKWFNLLCDFVLENKIPSTCVEVDCQKILGVQQAWEYRIRMKEKLPNNRQINVFHLDDGQYGLDKLIDFSDYIAIGVPEFRKNRQDAYKEYVYKTIYYIKEKKPEIDIHLLGCTNETLLKRCRFCTSCDSTTHLTPMKYNTIFNRHTSNIKKNVIEDCVKQLKETVRYLERTYNYVMRESTQLYYGKLLFSYQRYLEYYTLFAGDQN